MQNNQNLVNDILRLNVKPDDYWRDRAEIPLFSKRPFIEYEKGFVPDDDVITYPVDTRGAQERTPFNALVCASTGVGKTRFIKNLVKGFSKQGYKILYIEPKSVEMLNARKLGNTKRKHHLDLNESLSIVSYVPNYIKKYIELNFPHIRRYVKFYSPDINKLNYREIWQSFGVPDKASDIIVNMIESRKSPNINSFISRIMKENLHSMTRQAALASLNNLVGTGFFGTGKMLALEKEWNNNNIVCVNYFSRDGAFMNTDIGLVLDAVRDIGMVESRQGLQNVTKKLIIFDDAFYYAGLSANMATRMSGGINLAIRNIANCQNNFRTWGIDTIFVVQSPDSNAIFPSLVDGCTTKFVSYVENPTALQSKLPFKAYRLLLSNKPDDPKLYIDEDNYVFQWIYVQGRTRWVTGFPFDCTVGH